MVNPPHQIEPKTAVLPRPNTILFDWHGTLVDTQDAMFEAMQDMLPRLEDLGLIDRLVPELLCRTADDVKLVRYIRIFRRLHPKILAERRVSRTDIFNAIFAGDSEAKLIAHEAYNTAYRQTIGKVHAFQQGIGGYLQALKDLDVAIGVATNRSREFFEQELRNVDGGGWLSLVNASACADDVTKYKPSPEVIHEALSQLQARASSRVWYVGDSKLDMVAAHKAGVSAIYYNGYCESAESLEKVFREDPESRPDAIVNSFDELFALLQCTDDNQFNSVVAANRPAQHPGPTLPPPRIEADWHPATAQLQAPKAILFDWHATLVDTLDAMYHAVDDMLPEMQEKGLLDRMVSPDLSRSPEDARLVKYVHDYCQLHPKVKSDRKISRTDIFEVLFGEDQDAKQMAHEIFKHHYRNHFGTVLPFEPQVQQLLRALGRLLPIGVITNRDREFFEVELAAVEGTGWAYLFNSYVCGDDTEKRKPHPDQLLKAAADMQLNPGGNVWYVGDSTTDVLAAKRAGMTSVFFNGAQWDVQWLEKLFPGSNTRPYKPDVVVNDFSEFWALVLACKKDT